MQKETLTSVPLEMIDSFCVQPGLLHSDDMTRSLHALWICRRGEGLEDKWAITIGKGWSRTTLINKYRKTESEYNPSNRTDQFIKRARFTLQEAIELCKEIGAWENDQFSVKDLEKYSLDQVEQKELDQLFGM